MFKNSINGDSFTNPSSGRNAGLFCISLLSLLFGVNRTHIKALLSERKVIGVDIVEVNPHLDKEQRTEQLMAYIV